VYISHQWHLAVQLRIYNYEVLAYPLAKRPMFFFPIKIVVRAWDKNDWKNCESMSRLLRQTRRKDAERKAIISLLYRFVQTSFSSGKLFSKRRLLSVGDRNFLHHACNYIMRCNYPYFILISFNHFYCSLI